MHLKDISQLYVAALIILLMATAAVIPAFGFIPGKSVVSGASYATFEGTAGNDYYDSMQYSYNINQWASSFTGVYPGYGNIPGYMTEWLQPR